MHRIVGYWKESEAVEQERTATVESSTSPDVVAPARGGQKASPKSTFQNPVGDG